MSYRKLSKSLSSFQRSIDQERLGGRFYQEPVLKRLDFWLVAEHLNSTNPHFHGFIVCPDDLVLGRYETPEEKLEAEWKVFVPSGSLKLKTLTDPIGWSAYSSKENSIVNSDYVIWSLSDYVNKPLKS